MTARKYNIKNSLRCTDFFQGNFQGNFRDVVRTGGKLESRSPRSLIGRTLRFFRNIPRILPWRHVASCCVVIVPGVVATLDGNGKTHKRVFGTLIQRRT